MFWFPVRTQTSSPRVCSKNTHNIQEKKKRRDLAMWSEVYLPDLWSLVVAHESNMGLMPALVGELYLVSTEVIVWTFQIPRLTSLHVSLFRSFVSWFVYCAFILFRVDKELIIAHTIRRVARWDIDFHHNIMIFASRCENVPVLCVMPKQDNIICSISDGVKLCKVTDLLVPLVSPFLHLWKLP